MSIFLSKNAQKQIDEQKVQQANEYRQRIIRWSDELVDWAISKDMTITDLENAVLATKERLQFRFGATKIDKLEYDKKNQSKI